MPIVSRYGTLSAPAVAVFLQRGQLTKLILRRCDYWHVCSTGSDTMGTRVRLSHGKTMGMAAEEYKIKLSDRSTKRVQAASIVFYDDEEDEVYRAPAADIESMIRSDVAEREARPRVKHAAI